MAQYIDDDGSVIEYDADTGTVTGVSDSPYWGQQPGTPWNPALYSTGARTYDDILARGFSRIVDAVSVQLAPQNTQPRLMRPLGAIGSNVRGGPAQPMDATMLVLIAAALYLFASK